MRIESMQSRTVVVGNSGSGKSTLARRLVARDGVAHLDLDDLAWRPVTPPERRPLDESRVEIEAFMDAHAGWVIEGCYADLAAIALERADALVWLDLPVERCLEHARARPWERHKYASPAAQDANLPMLLEWIAAYDRRDDPCSRPAHQALLDGFDGPTRRVTAPEVW